MRIVFLIIFFCFSTSVLFAQIDSNNNNALSIPAIESDTETNSEEQEEIESKPITNPGLSNMDENKVNGLSIPDNKSFDTPKKEFSMFETETFGDPGELYTKQIKKHTAYTDKVIEKSGFVGDTEDQFLGDFKTTSSSVSIVYRDSGTFDGDHIRIFLDGDVIRSRVLLPGGYNGFKIKLREGINKFDFLALDTGLAPPNTAEFQILDENQQVISANNWGLAAGVKATIVIIKE